MSIALPTRLYSAADLLEGFNPHDDLGFTLTRDFASFRQFVVDGGPVPPSLAVRTEQADHDAAIADALRRLLHDLGRPLVGIMGGHAAKRNSAAFADIAALARELARAGYLIVTGGGPGIMEAAHVGVAFSRSDDAALQKAIGKMKAAPHYGNLDGILETDGSTKLSRKDDLIKARNWLQAALEARADAPSILPISLAIPTWLYGAEPTMPFATHYAKYFQNSLREEALVNNSRAGIVYGQGGGGTLREVFQDVERNYYATSPENFTPMIFFDKGGYWTNRAAYDGAKVTSYGIKLDEAIPSVLRFGLCARMTLQEEELNRYLEKITFSNDLQTIKGILAKHAAKAQSNLHFALKAMPMSVAGFRMNRA